MVLGYGQYFEAWLDHAVHTLSIEGQRGEEEETALEKDYTC